MLANELFECIRQRGRAMIGERVARVPHRVVDIDQATEIHRRARHDEIALDRVNRRLELLELLVAMAKRAAVVTAARSLVSG